MSFYMKNSKDSGNKIILLGLSQSGKTSIFDVIFGGKTPEDTQNYSATLNYERHLEKIVDEPITIMDLGGQDVFLNRFLGPLSSFIFSNLAVLVFICDISVPDKFPASLKLFKKGVDLLEEMSGLQSAIFILLHKVDLLPDITRRTERFQFLREMFQDAVPTKSITFFQTSIYDQSIHEAFQRITAQASEPISEEVNLGEEEDDMKTLEERLQRKPIQYRLNTLMLLNRLDEVLLLSFVDPKFVISATDSDLHEIQEILILLRKSNVLKLPKYVKSEIKRIDTIMMYKSKIKPHHLLILVSSDTNAMLEKRKLHEIEDQIQLLSTQLENMLITSL